MPLKKLLQFLGIDTQREKYRYGVDPVFGYTSAAKIPDRWVKTTCGYCSVGCGMYLGVKEGRAVAVRGDPDHPVNEGALCPKGLSEHHSIHAEGRALKPLLKLDKKLKPVSWDLALETLVGKALMIQRRHGNEAFAVLSTGQLVTEEFYTLGKLVQLGFGTKNYDGNTTLCMSSAVSGYKRSFGSDGPPGAYEDLATSDCILLIGANIADNHPILWRHLEKNPNRFLVVADPRLTKTAMLADLHLPLKPRSDIALINGIMRVLIREGRIDRDYIREHTRGFEELQDFLEAFTLPEVARWTGLSEDLILRVARAYGEAKAAFIGWTMGVNHSTQGTETVNAINTLALITGNVGRTGAAPFSITGQCNAMGTREAGFTSSLPGYRKFESAADRDEIAGLWGVEPSRIPDQRGLAYPDIIEGIIRGKVKGLWIIATNPLVSYPNQELLKDALSRLEFLVVQDGYHPTPTSKWADLVLPAAIWGEKEGTFTNSERRVSKVNAGVPPPGEAKPDFEIFLEIAKKLGCEEQLFPGWTRPEDAFNEWRKVSRGRLCDYSELSYERLEREGPIQWGGERLYTDGKFPTEDGRARLWAIECHRSPEEPNAQYPFILNTGRTVEHWHTRTKTGKIDLLESIAPEAWVEIHPEDAGRLKIRQHDRVRLSSQRGSIERIAARITATVQPGQVFVPFHYIEACANNLTAAEFDPISREPNYKQCAVQVEKLGGL
ncbi:MAG TPA: molybdopterin-dependent oxidoreductase [bacterium]|nr:molybdopterin-dependent oxidoreductase [bacterium]